MEINNLDGKNEINACEQDDTKIANELDKLIVENTIAVHESNINEAKIEIEVSNEQNEALTKEEINDNIDLGDEGNSKEENNLNDVNESKPQKESHKKEKSGFMRLPMSKVKNIMKLDEDVKLCQKNAYYVVGKLTELFLQELASDAASIVKINKRRTMNLEDIACALKSTEKYNFIDVKTIFNVETIEDLKKKEEKFEKKVKQVELKSEKKSKIEKVNKKSNLPAGNMRIDKMFGNNI